jgi:hypothetical protein
VIDDAEDLRRALEHPRLRRQDRQERIGATVEIGGEAVASAVSAVKT